MIAEPACLHVGCGGCRPAVERAEVSPDASRRSGTVFGKARVQCDVPITCTFTLQSPKQGHRLPLVSVQRGFSAAGTASGGGVWSITQMCPTGGEGSPS